MFRASALLLVTLLVVSCGKSDKPAASATGGAAGIAGSGGAGPGGGEPGGTSAGGVGTGGVPHTGAWRIVPLGDSITGTTCYPQLLSQSLISAGRTNFEFVGTVLNNQSCNGAPFVDTEGHGGYLVTDLVGTGQHASELPEWCTTDQAEVVLMHFGTNDAWSSRPTQTILDAYSGVVAALRAVNPNVVIFVAQIIPLNPTSPTCATCDANVQALNAAIPGWATAQSTATSPIYVVDQYTGFDSAADTRDGVHPNLAGSTKMADQWSAALAAHGIP